MAFHKQALTFCSDVHNLFEYNGELLCIENCQGFYSLFSRQNLASFLYGIHYIDAVRVANSVDIANLYYKYSCIL
jgi:hypothetical protein